MSGRVVSLVLASDLPPDLKFTAAVFASFADEQGHCWPTVGHVAYLRGLKVRAVQYHVKELRDMEVFQEVRPATNLYPAHYRIRFEKLPSRAPYKPPDRQPYLLGPPGEALGVQPAAPQLGVQNSALGVQPVAPDPSLDPSQDTRTPRAREAATNLEVQPIAPQESALPLIVAPRRDPDHAAHAWCGRICVPKFLHKQFKKALGGPVMKRAARLRAFYAETIAAIASTQPIGDEPVKFWRRAFAARFQFAAPDARVRVSLFVEWDCPHDPPCGNRATCAVVSARKVG